MQDIIFKVMAVAIVLGGCVWGWWTEEGLEVFTGLAASHRIYIL